MKIGLFDSGLGGLNVLAEFRRQLPQYDYIYLGDQNHAPLGDKKPANIKRITTAGVKFLQKHGARLIILACNTATAASLKSLQKDLSAPLPGNQKLKILGIIRPTTELIVDQNWQKVGVMATSATIKSKIFRRELNNFSWTGKTFSLACPQLVPLIENGLSQSDQMAKVLSGYLKFFKKHSIEALVLGCTHYSLIKPAIKSRLPEVKIIAEEEVAAPELKQYLIDHPHWEKQLDKTKQCQCFFTFGAGKPTARYQTLAKQIMPNCRFTVINPTRVQPWWTS